MPKIYVSREFTISASHFLTDYNGKCEHLHGHNYKLIVTVVDQVQPDGMVKDFKELKNLVNEKIIEKLDHKHLNDIMKNPTAENICVWIWDTLKDNINLHKLTLYETDNCYVEYKGEK